MTISSVGLSAVAAVYLLILGIAILLLTILGLGKV
jgi:hypothetical protein